jgi:hypothetical protein
MALKKELQENFQIANISELVSFDEEETNLSADGLEISFNTKNFFYLLRLCALKIDQKHQ